MYGCSGCNISNCKLSQILAFIGLGFQIYSKGHNLIVKENVFIISIAYIVFIDLCFYCCIYSEIHFDTFLVIVVYCIILQLLYFSICLYMYN